MVHAITRTQGPRKLDRCTAAGQPLSWLARSGCQANPTQRLLARAWQDSAHGGRTPHRTTAQDVTEGGASRRQVAKTPLVGQPLLAFLIKVSGHMDAALSGALGARGRAQQSLSPSRDSPYADRGGRHSIDGRPIHRLWSAALWLPLEVSGRTDVTGTTGVDWRPLPVLSGAVGAVGRGVAADISVSDATGAVGGDTAHPFPFISGAVGAFEGGEWRRRACAAVSRRAALLRAASDGGARAAASRRAAPPRAASDGGACAAASRRTALLRAASDGGARAAASKRAVPPRATSDGGASAAASR